MTWPPDGTGGKSGCWMLALWADSDSYRGRTLTTVPDTAGMGPDQVCGYSLGKTHFRFCFSLLYGWLACRGLGARVLPAAGQSLQKPCKGFKLLCSLPFHRQTLMVNSVSNSICPKSGGAAGASSSVRAKACGSPIGGLFWCQALEYGRAFQGRCCGMVLPQLRAVSHRPLLET